MQVSLSLTSAVAPAAYIVLDYWGPLLVNKMRSRKKIDKKIPKHRNIKEKIYVLTLVS